MRPKAYTMSETIPVIRPLLCTTRDYIRHYLRDIRQISWVEDSTNSDTRFKRNAVRAMLAEWSKAEIEHFCRNADACMERWLLQSLFRGAAVGE